MASATSTLELPSQQNRRLGAWAVSAILAALALDSFARGDEKPKQPAQKAPPIAVSYRPG